MDCDNCAGETVSADAKNCKIRPLRFDGGIPDEIECGTPVIIKITGGKTPFTWQVSGNGFTLSEINEREYSYYKKKYIKKNNIELLSWEIFYNKWLKTKYNTV